MHLLDTEVVWALRGVRTGQAPAALAGWAAAQPRTGMFVSALLFVELDAGAAQVERIDKAAAAAMRRWTEERVVKAFDGRVLPVDAAVARRASALGYSDLRDGLLAATALEHGLTLATRHAAAFRTGKVKLINPWSHAAQVAEGDDADWRQASRGGPWLRNLFARG